ncbi:MAG: hypothetical protein HKN37_13425 [Rhodothermales bacterium]|nr:hypothetical protein [Rhodothermales bacterium]
MRIAIHGVFVLSLVGTGLYYLRLSQERHIALGVHGTATQNVVYIRSGSPADRAGIQIGDVISKPGLEWLDGLLSDESETFTFLMYRGSSARRVTLTLDDSATLGQRLAGMPPDMATTTLVGILALLLGWWIFARNPDATGIVPFALWSAATGPFWVTATWSGYWSLEMWSLSTIWGILAETALQAFSLHWLLIFPRRIATRWVIRMMYGLMLLATFALYVVAINTGEKPYDLMSMKGMVTAATSVLVCLLQLGRAPSIKARRRASWVLSGVVLFSLVSFFLWDAPDLAGIALPFGGTSEEMIIAITYLCIPIGIAIAITREGLFGIDRFITRGMAAGATLLLLFFFYIGAAYATASMVGVSDRSSIPVFWGFAIACALAVVARPLHVRLESLLDRVFTKETQKYNNALREFDERVRTIADRKSLEHLTCHMISMGLGVSHCSITDHEETEILVSPGALSTESYTLRTVVHDALPGGTYMRYPIRVADHYFGTAEIGSKENNVRFTDQDLLFLERLTLRCADQSARMVLYDQALRRELDFAQTRLRIAADLHDDIGSNLSGIALMTETAAGSPERGERLLEISRFARSMVDSLRDIVWSIDPDSDSPGQLVDRMKDAASALLAGVEHSFKVVGRLEGTASPVFQRNVFLIFKEAIHNIARHSQATVARIGITAAEGEFQMIIYDNGVGFDTEAKSTGLGQKTMVRRAERIGGVLTVESSAHSGTTITLRTRMA